MHACMYACIHTYIHTYIQKYIHTYIYAHIHRKGKEMFYLTTHSTHFIYGYMTSGIW